VLVEITTVFGSLFQQLTIIRDITAAYTKEP